MITTIVLCVALALALAIGAFTAGLLLGMAHKWTRERRHGC